MFTRISEVTKKETFIRDLATKGFGIPFTSIEEYKSKLLIPTLGMTVQEYLKHALSTIV